MNDIGNAYREPPGMPALMGGRPRPGTLRDPLRGVAAPETGVDAGAGLVCDAEAPSDSAVTVTMTLTTPGCPPGGYLDEEIRDTLPGVPGVDVQIVWQPPWDPDEMMSGWAKAQLGWKR